MAGTARTIKAFFSKHTVAPGGIEDGLRALTEEHNKLVADMEVMRVEVVAETTSTIAASAFAAAVLNSVEAGTP